MGKYFLSPEAQKSLKSIRDYSIKKFGKHQTTIYLKLLRNRMRYIAGHPKHGQARDELKAGYYSCFEGSHTIYYRIQAGHIEVIDVLHQSMDPSRNL